MKLKQTSNYSLDTEVNNSNQEPVRNILLISTPFSHKSQKNKRKDNLQLDRRESTTQWRPPSIEPSKIQNFQSDISHAPS